MLGMWHRNRGSDHEVTVVVGPDGIVRSITAGLSVVLTTVHESQPRGEAAFREQAQHDYDEGLLRAVAEAADPQPGWVQAPIRVLIDGEEVSRFADWPVIDDPVSEGPLKPETKRAAHEWWQTANPAPLRYFWQRRRGRSEIITLSSVTVMGVEILGDPERRARKVASLRKAGAVVLGEELPWRDQRARADRSQKRTRRRSR